MQLDAATRVAWGDEVEGVDAQRRGFALSSLGNREDALCGGGDGLGIVILEGIGLLDLPQEVEGTILHIDRVDKHRPSQADLAIALAASQLLRL